MSRNSINKLHGSLTIRCQRNDSTTEGIAIKIEKQLNETVEKKIALESEKLITFGIQNGLVHAIREFENEINKKRNFENPKDKNINAHATQNEDENTMPMVDIKGQRSQRNYMKGENPGYNKEEDNLYDVPRENKTEIESSGIKTKTHQEEEVVKGDRTLNTTTNGAVLTVNVTRGNMIEATEVKIEKQQEQEVLNGDKKLDQTTTSTLDTSDVNMGTVEPIEIKIDTQEVVQYDDALDELYASQKSRTSEQLNDCPSQMQEQKKERGSRASRILLDIIKPPKKKIEYDQEGKKVWLGVCKKLLENGAEPHVRLKDGDDETPYSIVVAESDKEFDELGALLLTHMPNDVARKIHMAQADTPAKITIKTLLDSDMVKTVSALLDCLIDKQHGEEDTIIHYGLLDADSNGFTPYNDNGDYDSKNFGFSSKSGLHELTYYGDTDLLYHDAVRLFIDYKWNAFGRGRFIRETVMYIISIFALTFSAGVACQAPDPLVYDTPLQIARAVFEVCTILFVLYHLWSEIVEMTRNKLGYWKSFENYFDLLSICLLLIVIPLRLTAVDAQWFCYAFGYICWILRILKYAPLSRRAGVYVHALWMIITQDIVRFIVLFTIILLAFSGSFQLSLRGEGKLVNLNYTMSTFGFMFIGIRTLVEQQPVIDYTNDTDNSNNVFSIFIMILYLSACVIVLLNLLIAQMNNRFNRIQYQCQRDLELSRAKIITRIERSTFLSCIYRSFCYKDSVKNNNYKTKLLKWEDPPLGSNERNVLEVRNTVNEIRDCMHHSNADCSNRNINAKLDSMSERIREIEMLLKRQGSASALRERGVRYQSDSSLC